MKSIITSLIALLSLSIIGAARGAELFKEKELNLSLFGSYVDKHDSHFAPGAGVSYFFTERIGVGAFTFWENYSGTFIDNLSAEGHFRWPLDFLPIAPYGLVGVGYSFETKDSFEHFGAGVEWRFNEKWGAFSDIRWQINNDSKDGVGFRIGARMVF